MSEIIEERNVGNKPIKSTYKGILRISNNLNLFSDRPDDFLSSTYYYNLADKNAASNTWDGTGINETYDFLTESINIQRFQNLNDKYTNLKVPVTDSMGNFLNLFLGIDGSTIGINAKENTDFDVVSINEDKALYLGLSKYNNIAQKTAVGANIIIENNSNNSLIIKNNYCYNDDSVVKIDENIETIFPAFTEITKKYDVLGYIPNKTEAAAENSNEEVANNVEKCTISLINLSDYIDKNSDMSTKLSPLPPGTIINQYCSLDKWFCYNSEENGIDDYNYWQGFRPSMYSQSAPYAYYNLVGNRACYSDDFLYYNSDISSKKTNELPPDFKRGYILCDGKGVTMHLYPKSLTGNEMAKKSLNLFFNLFYVLGYYYHNSSAYLPLHACEKIDNTYYEYPTGFKSAAPLLRDKDKDGKPIDHKVIYAITMATILAFKAFENHGTIFESQNAALKWIEKDASFPEDYIFDALSNNTDNYYPYSGYSVKIGNEINSFTSEIPYYEYIDGNVSLTSCKICNTAEVRHIAKLFSNDKKDSDHWENYNYTFYVPKLYTNIDPMVNKAKSYRNKGYDDKVTKETISQFIGSNGLLIAENIEGTITENPYESHPNFTTIVTVTMGQSPHAHAVTKGKIEIKANVEYHIGDKDNIMGTYHGYLPEPESTNLVNNLSSPNINKNKISESEMDKNTNIVASDFFHYNYRILSDKSFLKSSMMNNYILQEVSGAVWDNDENSFTFGSYSWYGRTSEPVWTDGSNVTIKTSKFNDDNSVGYFRPESIKVLPLIKL